jgi:hypothetical protein
MVIELVLETNEIILVASGSADKVETCIHKIYNFLPFAPNLRKIRSPESGLNLGQTP